MSAPEPLAILYLDEHVVVAAKPPGLLVHRTHSGSGEEALLQRLRDQLGRRVFPVQRLDRWASGLVAFGLDPQATADLQAGLQAPEALKEYLVLARGAGPERFESRAPLVDDKGVARTAHTAFVRLAFLPGLPATLLRARLHTGRYHQIRRHLALLGHHVVGDPRYGKARTNRAAARLGLARLFLHAWRLAVPRSREGSLAARAPLAADLREFLARLHGAEAGAARALGVESVPHGSPVAAEEA